jgi:sigma-E factor negative regulatory protein RseC
MKTEVGVVIEINGNLSEVRMGKHSDCKDCGACPGSDSAIITADNRIGAKPGQRVSVELQESNALKGAFVIFVLPLIIVFIGVIAGKELGGLLGVNELISECIGGTVFFVVVIVLIRLFDNFVAKKENSIPVILEIAK